MSSMPAELGAPATRSRGRRIARLLSGLHTVTWMSIDAIVASAASIAGHWLSPVYLENPIAPATLLAAGSFGAAFLACAYALGLHDPKRPPVGGALAARTLAAAASAAALTLGGYYWLLYRPIGRIVTVYTIVFATIGVAAPRAVVIAFRRAHPRRLLFVGASPLLAAIRSRLDRELAGLFEMVAPADPTADLGEECQRLAVDEIVLSETADPSPALRCLAHGCRVRPEADFYEDVFQGFPVEHASAARLLAGGLDTSDRLDAALRRVLDVALALAMVVATAPIVGLAALAIAADGAGAIFYTQDRVGRYGRPFRIVKLRTMRPDAEAEAPRWASAADPRQTRVGRWLRRTRIDELPQLVNVLRGEMSFVGPRPERPELVHRLEAAIPHYSWRHLVRPGITGWAQIHLPYAASTEDSRRKLELDLYYVRHRSLVMDLAILLRTATSWMQGSR